MTIETPTDEHCRDHEYIATLTGVRFIVNTRGEYRIHPEEIPQELRDKPLPPSRFWGWKKTGLAWLAGAAATLLISLAMHQRDQHLFALYIYVSILLPVLAVPTLPLIAPVLDIFTHESRQDRGQRSTS